MSLSKKARFEVFKRDSFTCQYCGKKAPDIVLEVDHIEPVSKGGTDDYLNLTTSCRDCNAGKSDRRLDDNSVVSRQRRQLEDLQERQEQIQMLIEWQRGLVDTETAAVEEAVSFWCDLSGWFTTTEDGKADVRKLIRAHGLGAILDAMRKATNYFRYDDDGQPTSASTELGFAKLGGIIRISIAEQEKPWLRDLFYTRGIIRRRLTENGRYYDNTEAKKLLQAAYEIGVPTENTREIAHAASSWTNWKNQMLDLLDEWEESEADRP